jgi:hypothetical protein
VPTIPVTDKFGLKVDLQFADESDAAHLGLQALESKTTEFATAAEKPLDQTGFRSGVFGGTFTSPKMELGGNLNLVVKKEANAGIAVYRKADGTLFKADGGSPEITITDTQAWVSFQLDTALAVELGARSPAGFGIFGKSMQARSISSYVLIESVNGVFPTLKESVEKALSNFSLPGAAAGIRNQNLNTVYEWDVAGTFSVEGSYRYPVTANNFALANMALPFHQELQIGPTFDIKLAGSLAVTGEFRGRCFRTADAKIQLGLYKKKESDFSVTFQAGAGLGVEVQSTDLVSALFSVLPGANFDEAQISSADRNTMQNVLQGAIDQGFSVALNSKCSASMSDEAAVLYEIDLGGEAEATDAALDAALKGNWTALSKLRTAKGLRNVLTETHESGCKTSLNLLGIYNFGSVQEFVRQCCILHNSEDGDITITDKETAQRIAVSSMPFAAQDDKLRKVLDEAFLATAIYTAADSRPNFGAHFQARQSLLIYNVRSSYSAVRKLLLLGISLKLLTTNELEQIVPQKEFKYFRLEVSASFAGDDALRLFFSDIVTRTAHQLPDLKRLGRQILASLLDRGNAADNVRWQALTDDQTWAAMEQQRFPPGSPASYSDWYDITFWAQSIANVAPQLKTVLDAADKLGPGDPTKNPTFMAERAALAKSVAEVTRNTKAAFEKGWPVAVMFALAAAQAPVTLEAQWDGKKQFEKQTSKVFTA